jgi:hypothetical protein
MIIILWCCIRRLSKFFLDYNLMRILVFYLRRRSKELIIQTLSISLGSCFVATVYVNKNRSMLYHNIKSYRLLVGLPGFARDFYCQLCLYVSLFLCLSISLSLCLFVSMSLYFSVSLSLPSISLYFSVSLSLPSISPKPNLTFNMAAYLSAHPPLSLTPSLSLSR